MFQTELYLERHLPLGALLPYMLWDTEDYIFPRGWYSTHYNVGLYEEMINIYLQSSNITGTLVGSKIADHLDEM